jgi:hypothetical protein
MERHSWARNVFFAHVRVQRVQGAVAFCVSGHDLGPVTKQLSLVNFVLIDGLPATAIDYPKHDDCRDDTNNGRD